MFTTTRSSTVLYGASMSIRLKVGVTLATLAFASVVFHMYAGDADTLRSSIDDDIDKATFGKRLVKLGDLVTLG